MHGEEESLSGQRLSAGDLQEIDEICGSESRPKNNNNFSAGGSGHLVQIDNGYHGFYQIPTIKKDQNLTASA